MKKGYFGKKEEIIILDDDTNKKDTGKTIEVLKKTMYKIYDKVLDEIKKSDSGFKKKMENFLFKQSHFLSKHLNYFASSDNKIYQNALPSINFKFLILKNKIVKFYTKNQFFLDKHPDLVKKLLRNKNVFDQKEKAFEEFTKAIREGIRNKSDESKKYKTFYDNVVAEARNFKFFSLEEINKNHYNELTNKFMSNYNKNLMLEKLLNNFTNIVDKTRDKESEEQSESSALVQPGCSEEKPSENVIYYKKIK